MLRAARTCLKIPGAFTTPCIQSFHSSCIPFTPIYFARKADSESSPRPNLKGGPSGSPLEEFTLRQLARQVGGLHP